MAVGRFSELRERRIVQILIGYAAAGWLLVEVVDQLVDRAIAPDPAYTVALVWYVGGFFASAIVGWYHGEKGRQKVSLVEVGLLAIVVVAVLGASASLIGDYVARQEAVAAAGASSMDLRRIAVRYFDDLSGDGEHGYLAGGLTDDLIDALGRVRTLDVVSRNGMEGFRGQAGVGADSVARALGAGTVLYGTVDAGGERVRLTVRVADGESGVEVLRASLEGSLSEVLLLREELARRVSALLEEWLGEEIELRWDEEGPGDGRAWTLVQRAERAIRAMEAAHAGGDRDEMLAAYTRADGLLEEAETLDEGWAEPATLRAWAAYRRSQMAVEATEAARWLVEGEAHTRRALDRSPNSARVLEIRGALRYRAWLQDVALGADEGEVLLRTARSDLERAVDIDSSRAIAHQLLSRLYADALHDVARASVAARTAYQEDPYLEAADTLVWRLFRFSWQQRQLNQARRWCEEGSRRFPADPRFVRCELDLMTTTAAEPDVDGAWSLVARLDSLAAGGTGEESPAAGRIMAAGVLARAGMPDSARAVLDRVRSDTTGAGDAPEILILEAEIRSRVLGDQDGAVELLERYRAARPDEAVEAGWWWTDLRGHPRFEELVR